MYKYITTELRKQERSLGGTKLYISSDANFPQTNQHQGRL